VDARVFRAVSKDRQISPALIGALLAVRLVAGEPAAVGGDEIVGLFLGPPQAGKPIEGERELQTEGDRQRSVDRTRSPPSAPGPAGSIAGLDCPGGAFALLYAETGRGGNAGFLVRHHRHAVVSVERLDEAHRPGTEPSSAVEYQD
jgi:hypothetical protein